MYNHDQAIGPKNIAQVEIYLLIFATPNRRLCFRVLLCKRAFCNRRCFFFFFFPFLLFLLDIGVLSTLCCSPFLKGRTSTCNKVLNNFFFIGCLQEMYSCALCDPKKWCSFEGSLARSAPRTADATKALQSNVGSERTYRVSLIRNMYFYIYEHFRQGSSMFFRDMTWISNFLWVRCLNLQ